MLIRTPNWILASLMLLAIIVLAESALAQQVIYSTPHRSVQYYPNQAFNNFQSSPAPVHRSAFGSAFGAQYPSYIPYQQAMASWGYQSSDPYYQSPYKAPLNVQTVPTTSQPVPGSTTILSQGEYIVPGSYQRVQPNANLPSGVQGRYVPLPQSAPPVGSLESIVNSQPSPARLPTAPSLADRALQQDLEKAKALIARLEATIVELKTSLADQETAESTAADSGARAMELKKMVANLKAELAHVSADRNEQVAKLKGIVDSLTNRLATEQQRAEKLKVEMAVAVRNARDQSRNAQLALERFAKERDSDREHAKVLAELQRNSRLAITDLERRTKEADVSRMAMEQKVAELTEVLARERQLRKQLETKLAEAIHERRQFSDQLAKAREGATRKDAARKDAEVARSSSQRSKEEQLAEMERRRNEMESKLAEARKELQGYSQTRGEAEDLAARNLAKSMKARLLNQKEEMLADVEKRMAATKKSMEKQRAELNEQVANLRKQAAEMAKQARKEVRPADQKPDTKKTRPKKKPPGKNEESKSDSKKSESAKRKLQEQDSKKSESKKGDTRKADAKTDKESKSKRAGQSVNNAKAEIARLEKERDRQLSAAVKRVTDRMELRIKRLKKSAKNYAEQKSELENELKKQIEAINRNVRRRFDRKIEILKRDIGARNIY